MTDRNNELAGKVAIVTGSARNIGRSIALELARGGADVTINAVSDKDAAEAVAQEVRDLGRKAFVCIADISKQEDVDRMVNDTVKEFGGLDILINNAAARSVIKFLDLKFEDWENARKVACDGGFRMSLACAPHIIKRGSGSIVGIHGMGAYSGAPNGAHKSAVKEAVSAYHRGMAVDLGEYDINVNMAVVGSFDTDRASGSGENTSQTKDAKIPMRRRGVPQDMANLIRFLVGPYGHYISGQTLHVNGAALMPH
ncbi:MAG: SDR family NAD(P)-dependent oxidoreductase [Rhodospirillales bacterium]|jgi:3-oxoacyl-[acyl-carrier protein] reductase